MSELLEQRGATAYRLSEDTGIPLSTAYRLTRPEPVQRVDGETLGKLCAYFSVQPGDLLVYEPDRPKRGR